MSALKDREISTQLTLSFRFSPEIIKQRDYIQILDPYVDDGISGETIDERPAMSKLLEDAERGLFDAVFVVDIDRLTRSQKSIDWEIIKDSLRKGHVTVVTPGTENRRRCRSRVYVRYFQPDFSIRKEKNITAHVEGEEGESEARQVYRRQNPLWIYL